VPPGPNVEPPLPAAVLSTYSNWRPDAVESVAPSNTVMQLLLLLCLRSYDLNRCQLSQRATQWDFHALAVPDIIIRQRNAQLSSIPHHHWECSYLNVFTETITYFRLCHFFKFMSQLSCTFFGQFVVNITTTTLHRGPWKNATFVFRITLANIDRF